MAAPRTHYETLNVSPEAEPVVIEAAYRALMKKYHPDQGGAPSSPGAPGAREINEAYAVLREPGRRAEYDQKEWTRQQKIQLASYAPPQPPRRTNFFGWGGWLVALVLAGMIGVIASRGQIPSLSPTERARAAAMAEPDLRTQPFKPGEGGLPEAAAAEIRADAYTGGVPAAVAATEPPPEPQVLPLPAPAQARSAAQRRSGPARPWRKPARGARTRAQAQKDFLEREGYIY